MLGSEQALQVNGQTDLMEESLQNFLFTVINSQSVSAESTQPEENKKLKLTKKNITVILLFLLFVMVKQMSFTMRGLRIQNNICFNTYTPKGRIIRRFFFCVFFLSKFLLFCIFFIGEKICFPPYFIKVE